MMSIRKERKSMTKFNIKETAHSFVPPIHVK